MELIWIDGGFNFGVGMPLESVGYGLFIGVIGGAGVRHFARAR